MKLEKPQFLSNFVKKKKSFETQLPIPIGLGTGREVDQTKHGKKCKNMEQMTRESRQDLESEKGKRTDAAKLPVQRMATPNTQKIM